MFLGGLGYNAMILYDEVGPEVDPFSPDNIVVISPGTLNGTGAPTACRTEISTKSPLTSIFGTGNFGGVWGQALKNAGYDTIVVRDRSPEPVRARVRFSYLHPIQYFLNSITYHNIIDQMFLFRTILYIRN